MPDTKKTPGEEGKPRRVGPKNQIQLPALRRIAMPHETLIPRRTESGEPSPPSPDMPVTHTSQPSETSLVSETSQVAKTRLVSDQSPDRTETSQVAKTRLVTKTNHPINSMDLMASLPDIKGYLKLWLQLIDYLYPQLDPFERAVHETLYRLSWGFGKANCTISYQKIAERTGMSPKSAQRAAARLELKGLVGKSSRIIGYNKEQGIEFSVVPAPRQVSETRQASQTRLVSETKNIDNNINNNTHTERERAGSRFSLEDCRRYADHLVSTGQGIMRPGGYATSIFRSGEADTQIEAFLNPVQPVDITHCPDCRGSNFVHVDPSDMDKGVRPCKHERL